MEKESSNILAVYDWFEVVCSGEVSWQDCSEFGNFFITLI